jgi:zinc transport system permease protein
MITSLSKGFNIDVSGYMFGSILAMTAGDVYLSAGLSIVVLLIYGLLFNRLFAITYDEVNARATGVNVTMYQFVISFLTAITVVLGMRMMGTMLISSLIIFPAITAKRLVGSFRGMTVPAAVISVICFFIGLSISFLWSLPTGASVVGVNLVALLISRLIPAKG